MKEFIKKYYKKIFKIIILAFDVLCVPLAVICRSASEMMLQNDGICVWTMAGIRCFTCGGTHFVNDLLSFRILEAMVDNPLLFVVAAYLFVTLAALNLYRLFDLEFARRMLRLMYNVPVIIAFVISGGVFFFVRNFEAFMHLDEVVPKVWKITLWMIGL